MASSPSARRVRYWRFGRPLGVAGVGSAVLLAVLVAARLGPAGLVVGALHVLLLPLVLARGARGAGVVALGPADVVTAGRAVVVCWCAALVADDLAGGTTAAGVLVATATVALILDAVDGRVARSTGTVSAFGARFDMEVDAYLLLILSVHATTVVGGWAIAIGAMRYLFVAAGWVVPWLRGDLPQRYSAKVVAAAQGIVLVIVAAQMVPRPWPAVLTALALGALVWSFATSVTWLWQHRLGQRHRRALSSATPRPGSGPGRRRADVTGPRECSVRRPRAGRR